MWDKIQYAFLYSWVKVHALLPMRALYVLSDILYVLIYKIAGYRVKVVRRNITASFPDKSKAELRQLERRFYHHFADYIVETIKLAHISLDEIQRRAYLKNPELVDQLMEKAILASSSRWGIMATGNGFPVRPLALRTHASIRYTVR